MNLPGTTFPPRVHSGPTWIIPLDRAWEFRRLAPGRDADEPWSSVDLPHTPFVADLDGRKHWFGECEYQRTVELPPGAPAGRCSLYLGAAMHSAVVLVDGIEVARHAGGYLPLEVDLTPALHDGYPHLLTIRLDNRDNADVPPGKPYADLDFCWFGGLYRSAELRCHPPVHITDAVGANETAGGGVFVRTLTASAQAAVVSVRTHVRNAGEWPQGLRLEVEIMLEAAVVARASDPSFSVAAGMASSCELTVEIPSPRLWQPAAPALYHARVILRAADGRVLDLRTERFGIRRIAFSRSGGFTINGQRFRPRGTNRHQDHPHAGYAVPRAAQYRDVGSSRVDLQACKLEYSIVSPK